MKFTRRTEGIKAARSVFKKAREDPRTTYQVYVGAGLMEYYCSKVNGSFLFIDGSILSDLSLLSSLLEQIESKGN